MAGKHLNRLYGPFIIHGVGWVGKNEGGVHDQSRRLVEGVIMKYINKCGGLLIYRILLLTVVIKIVHTQKITCLYRKQSRYWENNVPTMRPDRICRGNCITGPAGLLHHRFHIRTPKTEEEEEENWRRKKKYGRGGRDRKAEQKEETELCTWQAFVDCSRYYIYYVVAARYK